MSRTIIILMLGWLSIVIGCSDRARPKEVRGYKLPSPPPAYPPKQDVPLDPALASAARQQILQAYASADPVIRAHAVEAMQNTVARKMSGQIVAALNDRSALVRFAATLAAGELQLKEATPALLVLAEDQDPSVRIGAKFALHKLGDLRFSHDFEYTCRDPVKSTRANTAMVLGMMGEPSAARILLLMLRDHEAVVRLQAAEALWRLHDARGVETLIGATISGFPDDQMIALLALAQPRDQRVVQNLRGALTSEWDEVALVAARAMGMLGYDEGYGVALKGGRSGDARQRLLAALAFGAIGRADAQDVLRKLLEDADQDVRVAAATAILQLKPER